jgi:3-(methylthio)propionyl---CoA ligase
MAGAALLAVNIRLDAPSVAFILRHSGARVLLVDRGRGAAARGAGRGAGAETARGGDRRPGTATPGETLGAVE